MAEKSKHSSKSGETILDKDIQRKQWMKALFFGLFTLGIIVVLGYFFRPQPQQAQTSNQLIEAMGTEKMSSTEKESIAKTKGVLDIQHWTTDKGMRVYYVHAPNLPMVDVRMAFDAGSAREGDKAGLAFLTNHLLMEGIKDASADEIAEQFESMGVDVSLDAGREMAVVHMRSLTDVDILTPAVKLLSKVIQAPTFPEKGVDREKRNMLKMLEYQAQRPKEVAKKTFYQTIYPESPYGHWPYGTKESIEALTKEDLVNFHKSFYVAQNAVISIVGAVDVEGANAIAEVLTDPLAQGTKASKLQDVAPLESRQEETIAFPSGQTHIWMGAPVLTRDDPDYFPLYVGNHILGGGAMVSRLFDVVRNDHGLAYDVHSYFIPMRAQGPFILGCQTKNESAKEALSLMEKTLQTFVEEGPKAEELEEAKLNILGGFPLRFDSNASISSAITTVGFYELPLDYFDHYQAQVEKVTLESIHDAFARRIHPDKMAVVMVGDV